MDLTTVCLKDLDRNLLHKIVCRWQTSTSFFAVGIERGVGAADCNESSARGSHVYLIIWESLGNDESNLPTSLRQSIYEIVLYLLRKRHSNVIFRLS